MNKQQQWKITGFIKAPADAEEIEDAFQSLADIVERSQVRANNSTCAHLLTRICQFEGILSIEMKVDKALERSM